ncbi:HvfC/BufC family peptide modification chaperone [Aeromonas schubertii]|uniref:HvfC/BufC family peptide modification chaperone n=1 Tax=Aeromonas schubertii TaxID=652 RepID=UPI001CC67A5C|nr:putative DNA-binding domain-containing protein [Aeromonas schubertii]MBZ6074434.1 putative DNA-binding domain-containing protein [Aeromonas schubertii]
MDRGSQREPVCHPPLRLQLQTEWLARRIRNPQAGVARPYVQSIRASVTSVLEGCFAMTLEQLAPAEREALVEGFVAHHGAQEPAFHHIATEFVRYLQGRLERGACCDGAGRLEWPWERLALLEYEWACLEVELDEAQVPPVAMTRLEEALWLNPTLRLLALPFVVRPGAVVASRSGPHYHALFRTVDHQVITQPLGTMDTALLQRIGQSEGMTLSGFARRVGPYLGGAGLTLWARRFQRLGILTAPPLYTGLDMQATSIDKIQGIFP